MMDDRDARGATVQAVEAVVGAAVGIVGGAVVSWMISRHFYERTEASNEVRFAGLGRLLAAVPSEGEGDPVDFAAVAYADVTNDGRSKLLIQHHQGQNARGLKVYDYDDRRLDFGVIGDLFTSLPSGFTVGDLDNDGQIEVATIDRDSQRSAYQADPAHVELLYRWDGSDFKVIDRRPIPRPGQGDWSPTWYTGPIGPDLGYGQGAV
jgi:hypothetical protein